MLNNTTPSTSSAKASDATCTANGDPALHHGGTWTGSQQRPGQMAAVEEALEAAFAAATQGNARYDQTVERHKSPTQEREARILSSAITVTDIPTLDWLESQQPAPIAPAPIAPAPIAPAPVTPAPVTSAPPAAAPVVAPSLAATIKAPTVTDAHAVSAWTTAADPELQKQTIRMSAAERSQRLRTMDDYAKPDSVSVSSWFKTAVREWFANQSIAFVSRIFGKNDARLISHLDNLAALRREQRLVDQAEQLHQEALALREHHYGRGHENCAVNLEGLARINHDQGRYADAERLYEEVIVIHEKAVRKHRFLNSHGAVNDAARERAIVSLLSVINELAQMFAEEDKYAESETQFKRALEAWNSFPVSDSDALVSAVQSILSNYKQLTLKAHKDWEMDAESAQTLILSAIEKV